MRKPGGFGKKRHNGQSAVSRAGGGRRKGGAVKPSSSGSCISRTSADVKETAAIVATEDDSCKIILTGAAVCQTGLDAAVAAAVKSLMPTEE